jgi:hypothetical protein
MLRRLQSASIPSAATVFADFNGSVTFGTLLEGVRFRCGVLFTHVLKQNMNCCLCLYVDVSFHSFELLIAALALNVRVFLASPVTTPVEALFDLLVGYKDVKIVASAAMRVLLGDAPYECFFLDTKAKKGLLGSELVRGPDMDLLLSGVLSVVPAVPLDTGAPLVDVVIHDDGACVFSSLSHLCEPLLHERLRHGSIAYLPQTAFGRVLGVSLALQCVLSGTALSIRQLERCDLTMLPLVGASSSCIVLCEPHEKSLLPVDMVPCEIVIAHSSSLGKLGALYEIQDHVMSDVGPICPVAALLFAALKFGGLESFLYSRPYKVTEEVVLQTKWKRSSCAISALQPSGESLHLASFVSCGQYGDAEIPSWCSEETSSTLVPGARTMLCKSFSECGLQMGPSFQMLQNEMEICEDRCRFRLVRSFELTVGLLNSILCCPLLFVRMLDKKRLVLPRRIARVEMFGGIPSRCFVRRNVDLSFDVVAIDSNARVVLKLAGLVFLPVVDPLRAQTFSLTLEAPAPAEEPMNVGVPLVIVGDDDSVAEPWLREMLQEMESVKWENARSAAKKQNRLLMTFASLWPNVHSMCGRLESFGASVVVVTNVAESAQHAHFLALARVCRWVRVVDVGAVLLTVKTLLEMVWRNVGKICIGRSGARKIARVVSSKTVSASRKGEAGVVVVVGSSSVAEFVLRSVLSSSSCDVPGLSSRVFDVAVLCGKSWGRGPDLGTVESFVKAMPSSCKGLVVLPAKSLFSQSLSELACAEYCLAHPLLSCLLCWGEVGAHLLEGALLGGRGCGVAQMPLWLVEEDDCKSAPSGRDASQMPFGVHSSSSFSVLSTIPASPCVHPAQVSMFVIGCCARLSTCSFPYLLERNLWDRDILEEILPLPSFAAVNTVEVAWGALEQGLRGETVPRNSACFASLLSISGTLAQLFEFQHWFGVEGCSLHALFLASCLLRSGAAQTVLVSSSSDENDEEGTLAILGRPFDSRSIGPRRSEGAAAVLISLREEGCLVAIEKFGSAKNFRKVDSSCYDGCVLVETDAGGAGDADAAEYASIRRRFAQFSSLAVLDACKGRFGDTGQVAGLVAVVAAIEAIQCKMARKFSWFSELNSRVCSVDAKVVIPLEDVSFAGLEAVRACVSASSPSHNGFVSQVVLRGPFQVPSVLSAPGSIHGCVLLAHSRTALQKLQQVNAEWLVISPGSFHLSSFLVKYCTVKPRHRLVAFGTSAKAAVQSLLRCDVEDNGGTTKLFEKVWIGFSPSLVGVKGALQELLPLCSSEAMSRFMMFEQEEIVDGSCLQLFRFQTLVFDWLSSVLSFDTSLNLLGIGAGTRNAVSVLVREREAFHEVMLTCRRDDSAKNRLAKRVCVLECFSDLDSVQTVMAPLLKTAVLSLISLGPSCTAVVLRRSRFVDDAQRACRDASIRWCWGSEGSLLWTPVHRISPLKTEFRLPANCVVHDLGTGWSASSSLQPLHELWTHPLSAVEAWTTKMLQPNSLLIDLGPSSEHSLAMVLKKSAHIACLSVFERRSHPLLLVETVARTSNLMPIVGAKTRGGPVVVPLARRNTFLSMPLSAEGSVIIGRKWETGEVLSVHMLASSSARAANAWRRVVAHHPALRSGLSKTGRALITFPAKVAAHWTGVSVLAFEEFDPSTFPRFCMVGCEGGVRLVVDAYGIGEVRKKGKKWFFL